MSWRKKSLTLEEFVHKSSGLAAQTFGLKDRGILKEGYYADMIIFKPKEVQDLATFKEPELLAEGIHYVFVNGIQVIDKGQFNGNLAGVPIHRGEH